MIPAGPSQHDRRSLLSFRSSLLFAFATLAFSLTGPVLSVASAVKTPSSGALRSRDPGFRQRFDDAIEQYLAAEYAESEVLFRRLDVETGLSSHDREVITMMIGKCLYGEGAYLDCRRHFERFRQRHPESVHESASLIYIGHCSYRLRDYDRAAQAYVTALGLGSENHRDIALANLEPLVKNALRIRELEYLLLGLGDDDRASKVRLWIADRWLAAGREDQAGQLYQRVVEDSRRSPSGREAAEQLERLDHQKTRIISIGVPCPLSGDFADYGDQVRAGALVAEDENADRVRVLIRDTMGDSVRAGRIADSLVNLGCHVVIGPLVPGAIEAAAQVCKEDKIVQILPLARREDFTRLSPYLFQMASSPARRGRLLAEFATKNEHMRRLAILASDTPEGHEAAEAFATAAETAGATVYPAEFFSLEQTDFGVQLRALKKRAAASASRIGNDGQAAPLEEWTPDLDGLLLWGDPEDFVLAVPQIDFHKIHVKYFGPSGWGETSSLGRIRASLDSVVFASDEWVDTTRAEWKRFAEAYFKRWGSAPTNLAGRVYDLIGWLAQDGAPDSDAKHMSDILTGPAGYDGATGHWRFNDQRQPYRTPIYRYRRGVPIPAESQ